MDSLGHKTIEEYHDYLKDKNVILVGPAGYLKGQNKGNEIDNYDVVIRVNNSVPILSYNDLGKRTDVLYHLLFKSLRDNKSLVGKKQILSEKELIEIKNNGVSWLINHRKINSTDRIVKLKPYLNNLFNWVLIPDKFNQIKEILKSPPSFGVLAIIDLLCSPIRNLTVIGFDFYESGYYEGYSDRDKPWKTQKAHDFKLQIKLLKLLYEIDSKLIIDEKLKKVMYE